MAGSMSRERKSNLMLSRWYDPIIILGIERILPARLASLLDALGVDVQPVPLHRDAKVTRWEDQELRQCLMKLLSGQMHLRIFNLHVAILSEQRRRAARPWALASSYIADIPLPVLSHYLNPSVLWCQCTPADAADLLLSAQPPTAGWSASDALALCTRRHQTLTRWLEGYHVLPFEADSLLRGHADVIDQVVEFCGLAPTAEALYKASVLWANQEGMCRGKEENESVEDGHAIRR